MKSLIVANWKCNPQTLAEAEKLFYAVKNSGAVICPPFVYLSALKANGAQDCFWSGGAYTSQISPVMLKNLGVKYVILGHSERRKLGETDEMISRKIKAALRAGLKPILCIEKKSQIPKNAQNLMLVFEPSSAISGGGAFRPYPVKEAKKIRAAIKHPFVLYGGSVNSSNAKDYIKEAGFQGLLVGQASLDAQEFVKIFKAVK